MRRKREDITTSIQRILDEKAELLDFNFEEPSNYPAVREGILQLELMQEINTLNEMLQNNLRTFKKAFKERCAQRETNSEQSNISFHIMPESLTNQLYWEIAQRLFQPQTMNEMLKIISPRITRYLKVEITYVQLGSPDMLQNKLSPSVQIIEHNNNLVAPVLIESLSHYVLVNDMLLEAKDIALFPLTLHVALHTALHEKYPDLAKSLYLHNEHINELSKDILALNSKGITPKLAIEQLIRGLTLGGEKITGQKVASQAAHDAIPRFFQYINALPSELKIQLRALEGINYTLGHVIDNEIEKGQCVETIAIHLKCILSQNSRQTILAYSSTMSQMDLNIVKNKYKYKNNEQLDTKKDGCFIPIFPIQLIQTVVGRITINSPERLIELIVNFPPTFYDLFWQNINLNKPDYYYNILVEFINNDLFNQEQIQALAKVITSQYSRFNFNIPILSWTTVFNNPLFLQEAIRIHPKLKLLEAITTPDSFSNSPLIFTIIKRPETLKILVDSLPEAEDLFKAIMVQNDDGNTPLAFATVKHVESLKIILATLPNEYLLKAVTVQNKDGNTPLCFAATKQPDAFKMLFAPLSENDRLDAIMIKNNDSNTLLSLTALSQPKSVKILLNYLPTKNHHQVITAPNKDGNTPLWYAATYQSNSFNILLTSLTEQDRINTVLFPNHHGHTILGTIANSFPKSLQVLESLLPQNQLTFIKLIKIMNKASADYTHHQANTKNTVSQSGFFKPRHHEKAKENKASKFSNELKKITSVENAIELIDVILYSSTNLFSSNSLSFYLLNGINRMDQKKNNPKISPEEFNDHLIQNWIQIKESMMESPNLFHNQKK